MTLEQINTAIQPHQDKMNRDAIMVQIRELQEQLILLERNGLKCVINNYFWTDISQKCRKHDFVLARQMYCYIRRDEGAYLNLIGSEIWEGYDHSSVIHSINEFEYRLRFNKTIQKQYQEVLKIYESKKELLK